MLPYHGRWRNAPKRALAREARLLMFAKGRNTPNAPDPNNPDETPEERKARLEQEERLKYASELSRRRAQKALNPDRYGLDTGPKSYEVIAQTDAVEKRLGFLMEKIRVAEENIARNNATFEGSATAVEIRSLKEGVETMQRDIKSNLYPLKEMEIGRWEQGKMAPEEFIRKLEHYVETMNAVDEADEKLDEKKTDQRKKGRAVLLENAKVAAEEAKEKLPPQLPHNKVKDSVKNERETWDLYTKKDKQTIIQSINDAAAMSDILENAHDDLAVIERALNEGGSAMEAKAETAGRKISEDIGMLKNDYADVASISEDTQKRIAGISHVQHPPLVQWVKIKHLKKAFEELMESKKELKKRKEREKIASAALAMGKLTYWIPGMGGKDLLQTLEEQQEKKKTELVEAYKKELGDNRNDYTFTDLFGKDGESGILKEYVKKHDSNRTRAVIEYAASKGLLFDIEGVDWKEYQFPGGYNIRQLVSPDWNDTQVGKYFDGLAFSNQKGKANASKAGEDYVQGRGTADGYIEPFTESINGLGIWFAKGIADKAMKKVSDGEMSARLTLAITDAWEHNPLFRKYVPKEWLDNLCGSGKQMLIGMTKFEKDAFLNGAKKGETDLTKIDTGGEKPRKSSLGQLIVASRNYLFQKDPSLRAMYENKKTRDDFLRNYQSKLLASQLVELPNKTMATIYSQELRPYHIKYGADMMRDAPVNDLGDDFFIKRSEIIRGNAALMKAVGQVNTNGFTYSTKARYFFSHIISARDEIEKRIKATGISPEEKLEMQRALQGFTADARKHLDEYIEQALQTTGADTILTEQHKDQDGRYIFLTLAQKGLISLDVIERIALSGQKGDAAVKLIRSIAESKDTPPELQQRAAASAQLFGGRGGTRRSA